MSNQRSFGATSRRSLLSRSAVLTGSAVAAVGVPSYRALAQEAGDSLLGQVLDRGTVRVGTGSTNPPWHFEDENGNLVGFDIEMAKLLAGGLFGLEPEQILADDEQVRSYIEFVVHESDARIPDLLADKVDINFQFMTVTAGRAQQVEFTIPYYREGVTLLLPADSEFNSLADMQDQGLTIAMLTNVYAEEMIHRGVPDAEVQQFDSVAASVEALDSGRVDATGIDLSTGRWMVAQDPDRYKTLPEGWNPQTYAASVKQGDQIWLNFVNTVLHEAMTGVTFPVYQQAFSTYFGVELEEPPTGFPVEFR
jgi:polar amino acid transport system substrate-binding protein